MHKITRTKFDESGNDRRGFNENKIHKKTGTNLDEINYNVDGKYGLPVYCPKCNGTDHENLPVGRSCHMPLTPFPTNGAMIVDVSGMILIFKNGVYMNFKWKLFT